MFVIGRCLPTSENLIFHLLYHGENQLLFNEITTVLGIK